MLWERVTDVMLLCILNFVCEITAKLIFPGAFGQSFTCSGQRQPHQGVLLLLGDINIEKRVSRGFSGPDSSGCSRETSWTEVLQRVTFLLLSHANLELQFNYFSPRSALRRNFELKFGSVWAAGSPPLLVPFAIP